MVCHPYTGDRASFALLGLPFMGWLAVRRISPSDCQQQIDLSFKAPHLSCVRDSGVSLVQNLRGNDCSRTVTVAGALVNLLSLGMFLNGSALIPAFIQTPTPELGERKTDSQYTLFQELATPAFCITVGVSTVDVCQSYPHV